MDVPGCKIKTFGSERVILQLWFQHMEKQAFLSSIQLAKACMIFFYSVLAITSVSKNLIFSHELCACLSRLNQHCQFCFSFTDFPKFASSLKASPTHSNLH